jgi:hypothetical protein
VLAAVALVLTGAVGCSTRLCGPGTEDQGGVCVPTLACGGGTVEDAGVCVPAVTCGPGTVMVNGSCAPLPPAAREVDVGETAEPNDPFGGGALAPFLLPGAGEPPVVVGGLVQSPALSPPGGDLDGFLFMGAAGTHVRFTGLSRGAAAVAFLVQGWEPGVNDTFIRWGFQGAGGSAAREVVLPADGAYALVVSEAANVLIARTGAGAPFGGEGDLYAVAVETLTPPDPAPLAVPGSASGAFEAGALPLFSVDLAGAGATLHFVASTTDPVTELAVLAFDGGSGALVGAVAGATDATVDLAPVVGPLVLVQDFVFGDGVAQTYTLTLQ